MNRQPIDSAADLLCLIAQLQRNGVRKPDICSPSAIGLRPTFLLAAGILKAAGGGDVRIYLDVVIGLNFLVDLFLLLGANRLAGFPQRLRRALPAAAIGGIYGGLCLVPGFLFLGNILWRIVSLCLMGAVCYGVSRSALRRCALFVFLCLALGGVAAGLQRGGVWELLAGAAAIAALCHIGFRGKAAAVRYVPVALEHRGKQVELLALQDTGNMLLDPVTGQNILVVSPEIASELLGLTRAQLSDPVSAISDSGISGLRLVSYSAVGQENGLLLALRLTNARIGNRKGSTLVAFSPSVLDREGAYQALTGGEL